MTRNLVTVFHATAGLLVCAGLVGDAFAQTPPSERELRIYAGLHDAAARGDVAEIEQLIAEETRKWGAIVTASGVKLD